MKVGVLALQGDVREHLHAIHAAGGVGVAIKHREQVAGVDALIVPGGESTTIGKLLDRFGLLGPITERIDRGMPVFGTCAGAILLARDVLGGSEAPQRFGTMDIGITRNAYGRQVDSFETDLAVEGLGAPLRAVFIRAPRIERVGDEIEVLARHAGVPVLVRERSMFAATFHPELAGDDRVHAIFLKAVES